MISLQWQVHHAKPCATGGLGVEVPLALLADAANTTENGKLNVLGVFSQLLPAELPYVHPVMTLVIKFEADTVERGSQKDIEIRLVDADGKPIISMKSPMVVPNETVPGRPIEIQTLIGLSGLRF